MLLLLGDLFGNYQETVDARRNVILFAEFYKQDVYSMDVYSMAILFAELLEPARPIFENMPTPTILEKVRVTPSSVYADVCVCV